MSLHEGTVLDSRYRVIGPLGEGGFGAAYLVEDQRLGRECVAKESTVYDTAHRAQFEQETGTKMAVDDYIEKPISPAVMIERVGKLLRDTN